MTQASTDVGFWNNRFDREDYAYGIQPNDFLRDNAALFRAGDAILSLAEGEGRNAVFLAKQGCKVQGVDFSEAGRNKALQLAARHQVELTYAIADLTSYAMGEAKWDAVVSIFCHLPEEHRPHLFQEIKQSLKPGGLLLLESYNKKQLAYGTGGPKDVRQLLSVEELKHAFAEFDILRAEELEREIWEGPHHGGKGAVTQFIARKPLQT